VTSTTFPAWRLIGVTVAAVAIAGSVAGTLFLRHPASGLSAARHIVADDGRFDSGAHAAQAIYDASRELLRGAERCQSGRLPATRCRALFEAAAVGQLTTPSIVHCQLPTIYAVQRAWSVYLAAVADSSAASLPVPPRC
jgi:hypothetical protein